VNKKYKDYSSIIQKDNRTVEEIGIKEDNIKLEIVDSNKKQQELKIIKKD
jgi:hypothetical protein